MRKILVTNIKGNEILAKTIISEMDTVLMPKGTVLRKNYAKKLNELKIQWIYIEDDISQGINEHEITENEIKNQCQSIVAETINKYAYSGSSEFEKMKEVAANIIEDMLSQPEIIFNISGVRQKSEDVYAHCINVCALSVLLALRLNLPKEKINEIAVGSVLHDIGYLNIPNEVIKKDKDHTEKEKRLLRMHVVHGYSILENEKWIRPASKEIVLSHHELMDGSGYPMHINGSKMRIGTKIVCVCNMFDNFVYGNMGNSMKVHEAIEAIVALGGRKLDLEVVKVFNESVAAYPVGTIVKTNEEETGIVLRQNNKCPTRPIIRILKDKDGKSINNWIEKDLVKDLTLFIKETLDDF